MDLSNVWPTVLPIIVAIIASSVGWYANRIQLNKTKAEAVAAAKAAEIARDKAAADLSEQSLGIARSAASDVITIRAEIRLLQDENLIMKEQIRALTADKRRLEEEKIVQGEKIAALENDNVKLRNRVDVLEEALRANSVPIPNGK